jgi:AAA+ ATPase superfamily predicted ATPase
MRIRNNNPQSGRRFSPLSPSDVGFFVDREKECDRLREAILAGQSLMISGPRGAGKTALVLKTISEVSPVAEIRCLYVPKVKDLQDLLRSIIRTLYEAEDIRLRRELHAAGVSSATFDHWLRNLAANRLRGTLYRAIDAAGYRVFLDHVTHLTPAIARVAKQLFGMRQTPVYVIFSEEPEARLVSHFFYWGEREILRLAPLPISAARTLLEDSIHRFDLARLDLEGFREQVLEVSQLLPGAIIAMCELASKPQYQFESRIKVKLVHIDYLMRGNTGKPKRDYS